jgi:prenyltransferase beta subunit
MVLPSLKQVAKKVAFLTYVPSNRILPAYADGFNKIMKGCIPYVRKLQQKDGGFSRRPEDHTSLLWATGQSLSILAQLNQLADIDLERTKDWVTQCGSHEGGFAWKPGVGHPNVENTMYGLTALTILGSEKSILKESTEFILNQYMLGGFSADEEATEPSTWATYNGLLALKTVNALGKIDTSEIGEFIQSCQLPNGSIEKHKGRKDATVYTTAYSLYAAYLIDQLDVIDTSAAVDYMLGRQLPDGGFPYDPIDFPEESPGQTWSTGHVITSIAAMNNFSSLDNEKTLKFFQSRQMQNGGFVFKERQPKDETNVSAAFMAVVGLHKMFEPLIKPEIPKTKHLPLALLKLIDQTPRVHLPSLADDLHISSYLLRKTLENLLAKGWIKGTIKKDTFRGSVAEPLDQLQAETDRIGVFRENINQRINLVESLVNQLKTKTHREVENSKVFKRDFEIGFKEISNQIKDIKTQIKTEISSYKFHNARDNFGDILVKWDNIERHIKIELEKIKFSVLWKTREQIPKKH